MKTSAVLVEANTEEQANLPYYGQRNNSSNWKPFCLRSPFLTVVILADVGLAVAPVTIYHHYHVKGDPTLFSFHDDLSDLTLRTISCGDKCGP